MGLSLTSGCKKAIIRLTRSLWILLGHYGSAIMGCASPAMYSIGLHGQKGQITSTAN